MCFYWIIYGTIYRIVSIIVHFYNSTNKKLWNITQLLAILHITSIKICDSNKNKQDSWFSFYPL